MCPAGDLHCSTLACNLNQAPCLCTAAWFLMYHTVVRRGCCCIYQAVCGDGLHVSLLWIYIVAHLLAT